MIRLSWRQFRLQAAIGAAGVLIVAVAVAITGPHLVDLYNSTIATCRARGDCATAVTNLVHTDRFLQRAITVLLFVVGALIGIFWGAPLIARELETGTFRLAWTQSVTRTRWLGSKLALVGGSAIIATGLLSLMVTWWFHPIDRANANRFASIVFDTRDVVPIGYAAFAFTLGVTAGVLTRRTLPAMATALLGFIAARVAITNWVRPNLVSPAHIAVPLDQGANIGFVATPSGSVTFVSSNPAIPNAWTISSRIVDKAGATQGARALHDFIIRACPTIGAPPGTGGHRHVDPGPTAGI